MLIRILKAPRSRLRRMALLAVMVCGLSACGQKGPLVPAAQGPATDAHHTA